jgi:hypothetical protein
VLTRIGLAARLTGTGIVTAQIPAAGSAIDPGAICELRLERAPLPVPATVVAESPESEAR